tara:strand:+ start:7281 stop:7559 length:279 start_codon:yes stop_codon:yes gene_type:complete
MTNDQYTRFQFVLLEMVFKEKSEKHALYMRMYEKLKSSKKQNKLKLSKYLLSRLLRESDRILATAQKFSTDNCPYKEDFQKEVYSAHSTTVH